MSNLPGFVLLLVHVCGFTLPELPDNNNNDNNVLPLPGALDISGLQGFCLLLNEDDRTQWHSNLVSLSDLKRNDYTPDKVTFPQEEPPNSGGGVKESPQSMKLMLWGSLWAAQDSNYYVLSQSQGAEEPGQPPGRLSMSLRMHTVLLLAFSTKNVEHDSSILTFFSHEWGWRGGQVFNVFCTTLWKCKYM